VDSAAYRAFFDANPQAAWICDASGRVLEANAAAVRAFGYSREEWAGMRLDDIATEDGIGVQFRRRDGSLAAVDVARANAGAGGAHVTVVTASDAAGPRRMAVLQRERLHAVEMIARNVDLGRVMERLAALVEEHCPDLRVSLLLLRHGRLYHAAGAAALRDFTRELDGLPVDASEPGKQVAPFWTTEKQVQEIEHAPRWAPWRAAARERGIRSCWSCAVLSGAGEILGALAAYRPEPSGPAAEDLPFLESAAKLAALAIEQHNMVQELLYQAEHDPLTRLPNRYRFEDRLGQAIRMAERSGRMVAVLHIDMDRFQSVNDLLGRTIGDGLLEKVARRLAACLRKSDTLARTGGDEFTVLLPEIGAPAAAETVAEKVLECFEDPLQVAGHELFVTASIGVSVYPRDAQDAATLLRNASDAMYRAKSQGRHGVQLFSAEMSRASRERLDLEVQLNRALDRGELALWYQPQLDLATGAMTGAEALLRWKSAVLGVVSPSAFIPVAEESGLIVPIGRWVLEEACRQRARWPAGPFRVAVNVSAVQFARPDFVGVVAAALERSGIQPALLELELTETAVMRDAEQAARQMHMLRDLGVAIAMDDFGTGYSSLSYLQKMPFEAVKIDQSFVQEIRTGLDRPPLVHSIVGIAQALRKRVTAEGIETAGQLDALTAMGCDTGQGFLLGKPMPADRLSPPVQGIGAPGVEPSSAVTG
jgi:diguanylate cyclase (GGDEF)-like protein